MTVSRYRYLFLSAIIAVLLVAYVDDIYQTDVISPTVTVQGGWNLSVDTTRFFGGSLHYSSNPSDTISYSFRGSRLQILGTRSSTAGLCNIWLDGGYIGQYSLTSSVIVDSYPYFDRVLSYGDHVLYIRPGGSGNCNVDSFRTYSPGRFFGFGNIYELDNVNLFWLSLFLSLLSAALTGNWLSVPFTWYFIAQLYSLRINGDYVYISLLFSAFAAYYLYRRAFGVVK
jgi:hypothetical protein